MQSLPRGWLIVGLGLAGWAAVIAIVVLISSLGATAAPWGGRLDGDDDGAPCEQLCGSNN